MDSDHSFPFVTEGAHIVAWLSEVGARFREAYRELSFAASVCLLGGLTWIAPYHRVAGEDSDRSVVTYRLRFYLRFRSDQLLRSIAMETNVVRGPDDLWYLSDGRLVGLEDLGT